MYPLNISDISSSTEFFEEVKSLTEESKNYLKGFAWCKKIKDGWLYTNLGYVLCIFLYEIENIQSPEDNLIWVIVGDLPAMYLDTFNVLTTKKVIETYIELAEDWIHHALNNQLMDECFPFQTEKSVSALEMLRKRVELLKNKILPEIEDIKVGLYK